MLGMPGDLLIEIFITKSLPGNVMDNQAEKDGQAQETSPLSEKEKEQRRVIALLKLETLKRVDLFSQFSESALRLLAKDCNDILVKKGEALCVEGAVETSMYVILSGEFEIYKLQKKVDVAVSGEYFGEMVLIDSQPRSATVRATTDSMVMQIDAEVFTKHIMDDPVHFFSMIKTLSLRAPSSGRHQPGLSNNELFCA